MTHRYINKGQNQSRLKWVRPKQVSNKSMVCICHSVAMAMTPLAIKYVGRLYLASCIFSLQKGALEWKATPTTVSYLKTVSLSQQLSPTPRKQL